MPTYAYRCTACEHQFEQFQRMADDPLKECPECDGLVKRVIYPVGVVFKGSGWYITDSRKSPSENGAGENGTGDKKSEAPAGEKPAETAKAAKTETTKSTESGGAEKKTASASKPLAAV